ncbi:MAG: glycosyltransferase [Candidatus Auribacterota bacterium]|nr:glycosyltransferase [Candidatus Auribacterota bacterium]
MLPIIFFPYSDNNMPSSYYRVYLMEAQLRKRGWTTRVIDPGISGAQKRRELDSLKERSIIYIQKTGNSFHVPDNFLPYREKHILIFDIDDYIDSPVMEAMMLCAHAVICGSHFLYDYAGLCACRTYLLPCSIDETMFTAASKQTGDTVKVVWSHCFADSYAEDLLSIAKPLRTVFSKHPFELILCGFRNHDNSIIKQKVRHELPFAEFIDYQPVKQFAKTILPVIQQANIAIVPFIDTIERRSKAGLTLRNYMLMGIPAVASPVGEHCHIIKHSENGFLASCAKDWERYITMLLTDKKLCESTGQNARNAVSDRYSTSATADTLAQILDDVSKTNEIHLSRRREANCAVVLGRIERGTDGCSPVQDTADGIPMLYHIQKMLKNTGLVDRVIFAMPDDVTHKNFAESIRSGDIEIKLSDRDNPSQRVYSVCPDNCTTVFKFVMEKPLADSKTLAHVTSLLRTRADIVRVHDRSYGIAFEGLTRKAVVLGKLQSAHTLRCCDGLFMGKPSFEPVSVALDTPKQITLFRDYILCNSEYSVEKFMEFAAHKKEQDKQAYYTTVKNGRAKPSSIQSACVILDSSCTDAVVKSFFHKDTVFCINEDFPAKKIEGYPFIRLSTSADQSIGDMDIAVEQGYRFTEYHKAQAVYSLSTGTAVFAVRLANRMSCPVYCYLSEPADPADRTLQHHLSMSDAVYARSDDLPRLRLKKTDAQVMLSCASQTKCRIEKA